MMMLVGTNLGPEWLAGNVTIGSQYCLLSGTGWNHTHVQCQLPEGEGTDLPVTLTREGESTTFHRTFNYTRPSIGNVAPAQASTAGGTSLTIFGSSLGFNFFPTDFVTVGGVNCPITFANHQSIVCTLPENQVGTRV